MCLSSDAASFERLRSLFCGRKTALSPSTQAFLLFTTSSWSLVTFVESGVAEEVAFSAGDPFPEFSSWATMHMWDMHKNRIAMIVLVFMI